MRGIAWILAAGVQTSAVFACEGGMTQVLQCDTVGGKQVQICIGDGKASYRFGPKAAPELALTQDLNDTGGSTWDGVGEYEFESIDFTNKGFTYNMIADRDPSQPGGPLEIGIEVTNRDGDIVGDFLACNPAHTTFIPGAVHRGFVEAGFCWDRTRRKYRHPCS